ncbi:MAG: N-acetyl sugar amidotransferase [Alphaproteobacteria bacterium]|uniref:N-acetyl sugar amidotransferase n=1 Tax=Candidatus Nitrobium versatile TaxID=2884831 RepID=A0A953LZN2_9BACT|nr:N-acetyl sugar amidotransferase [Candidatus Nitrobium versatile]
MKKKIYWCKNCLNMSTRPRIIFDYMGWCNACQWMEEKKEMDWTPRIEELKELLSRFRGFNKAFDCIVPVSGGKDGSYVTYQLKHKYGMNPLTVTVRPALSLEIGERNLLNFINSGYNHIHVSPDPDVMRALNKYGFIEKGFPYFGWLTSIMTSVIRVALNFNIPLIFYGEDGEVEYGGSTETKNRSLFSIEYMKRIYLEGGYDKVIKDKFTEQQLYFWLFPEDEELKGKELYLTHWSYFENWDSYRNYLVAKEHCGLLENEDSNSGTFTNFAQNDQALYALHTYMMYLKFGFGRATQDAGIEIRRGAMTRDQAINLVRMYDNQYPEHFIATYLNYYGMSKEEFDAVLDKWVNRALFKKRDGIWQPTFEVGEDFETGCDS